MRSGSETGMARTACRLADDREAKRNQAADVLTYGNAVRSGSLHTQAEPATVWRRAPASWAAGCAGPCGCKAACA